MAIQNREMERLLQKYAQETKQNVDKVVEDQIKLFKSDTEAGWPTDTFFSIESIGEPEHVAFAHWRFRITAPYAGVIEYGGYPGVGPKTSQQAGTILPGGIAVGGGIYPTQRPSAPVRRALSKRKVFFIEALKKAAARKYANA